MFKKFGLQGRLALSNWQISLLLLVFAFSLGSVGGATPVRAAAPGPFAVRTTYTLDIRTPVPPICAGQDYSVLVYALKTEDTADENGKFPGPQAPVNSETSSGSIRTEQRLFNIKIGAFAKDPSVATLSPKELITGWDIEASPNAAAFSLHAKKAGKTDLYFEALLNGHYYGPSAPIEVVNCQYKVSMVYVEPAQGSVVVYKMRQVKLAGDGVDFTGGGTVTWRYTILAPPCRLKSVTPDTQANITGHLDSAEKKLTLKFKFTTAMTHGSASCFGKSGSTDVIWDFNPLFSSATLPENGGSRSYPAGAGTVVVSLVPSTGTTP